MYYLKKLLFASIGIFILVLFNQKASAQTINSTDYPQLTDIPTVYITVAEDITDEAYYKERKEEWVTASMIMVDGETTFTNNDMKIRGRGNSSWNSSKGKRPYRIKFSTSQKLLGKGYAKSKNWVLFGNEADKSLIRNAISYNLGKSVGMDFCPSVKFVDLYLIYPKTIKTEATGWQEVSTTLREYRGTYQITDHINCDDKRIEVDENNGWYLEFVTETNAQETPGKQLNNGPYMNIKNPDDYLTTALQTEIETFAQNTVDAMKANGNEYSKDYNPETNYRKYVDGESLFNWFIGTEYSGNYDGMITIKLYKDVDDDKLHFGPLWDFDLAYDNCSSGDMTKTLSVENESKGQANVYLFKGVLNDPWFANAVNERWKELLADGIQTNMKNAISYWSGVINQSQAQNYAHRRSTDYISSWAIVNSPWIINESSFDWQKATYYDTYAGYITYLNTFIDARTTVLTEKFQAYRDNFSKATSLSADASSTTAPTFSDSQKYQIVDATVSYMSLNTTDWTTICLPFDCTLYQLKTALGTDFEIRRFKSVVNDSLQFKKAKYIHAGEPYIIKLDNAVTKTSLSFTNVTLSAPSPKTITHNGYSFTGVYAKTDISNSNVLTLGPDNNWAIATSGSQILGMKAYLTLPEGKTTAAFNLSDFNPLSGDSQIATNIRQVENSNTDNTIYNLNGQRINKVTGKGVYIINGKKVVMK